MAKKNKVNSKIEKSDDLPSPFTATAHATFPLDYQSKNDLWLVMIFIVETRNKNPYFKKTMFRGKASRSKMIFGMQRRHYIMYWLE